MLIRLSFDTSLILVILYNPKNQKTRIKKKVALKK